MKDEKTDLTEKESLFIDYYLGNGFNATKAAVSAGYSENTAAVIGHENLRKPKIKQNLAIRAQDIFAEDKKVLVARIKEELEQSGFSKLGDYLDEDGKVSLEAVKTLNPGAVKEYTVKTLKTYPADESKGKPREEVLQYTLKLHNKERPLEVLAKHAEFFKELGTPENPIHVKSDIQAVVKDVISELGGWE